MAKKSGMKLSERMAAFWRSHSKNVMLAVGLILTVLGIVLLVLSVTSSRLLFLRPTFIILVGAAILYFGLADIRKSRYVFLGSVLTLTGIVLLLFDAGILGTRLDQLWPFLVIICGVAFVPTGYFHMKKFHPVYVVPAAVLGLMGGFFLLFSLNIIEESFSSVMGKWWPALFIICGLMLTGMFFKNNHQIPDDNDDTDEDQKGYGGGE